MNILPLVFALLLFLSTLTYARVQVYVTSKLAINELSCALRTVALQTFNRKENKIYDKYHGEGSSSGKHSERSKGKSKIPIRILISQETDAASYENNLNLLKRTITILFQDFNFYQKFIEQYPNGLDTLLDQLREATLQHKLSSDEDLSYLRLNDPEVQDFWNQLMQPHPQIDCHERTYEVTLTNVVSVKGSEKDSFRLQLLPNSLLLAITQNSDLARQIDAERRRLHRELRKKNLDKTAATEEFRRQFEARLPETFTYDFSITTRQLPRKKS